MVRLSAETLGAQDQHFCEVVFELQKNHCNLRRQLSYAKIAKKNLCFNVDTYKTKLYQLQFLIIFQTKAHEDLRCLQKAPSMLHGKNNYRNH